MALIDSLRLVGPVGSNKVMAGELSRLARRAIGRSMPEPKKAGTGALVYPMDPELAALAVTHHRTSSRVLWDICESHATRLEPLHEELGRDLAADRRAILRDGDRISIRARNLGEFAAGAMQVVGAVKNALVDGAARRGLRLTVDAERPDVLFALRMHDGVVTLSVDLVGGSQHERGYRADGGAAPLRENLAAVLVMLARFDARSEALIDPMCGSGTIAIEAALMARGAPLRADAGVALLRLPAFAGRTLVRTPLFGDTTPVILASDVNGQAVDAARRNARRAGVAGELGLEVADARALDPVTLERRLAERGGAGRGGVILCNPPYGGRLEGDVLPLYRSLGQWFRTLKGFRAGFLVGNRDFPLAFGGTPRVVKPLPNGNQPATFYLYDAA